mmetsp:Transcript_50196/g.100999  ORF Transcript_50196/g.100999 Transcript_50196/m.100999 type:complete len:405 (-) Transcript_50196:46-1260(-)
MSEAAFIGAVLWQVARMAHVSFQPLTQLVFTLILKRDVPSHAFAARGLGALLGVPRSWVSWYVKIAKAARHDFSTPSVRRCPRLWDPGKSDECERLRREIDRLQAASSRSPSRRSVLLRAVEASHMDTADLLKDMDRRISIHDALQQVRIDIRADLAAELGGASPTAEAATSGSPAGLPPPSPLGLCTPPPRGRGVHDLHDDGLLRDSHAFPDIPPFPSCMSACPGDRGQPTGAGTRTAPVLQLDHLLVTSPSVALGGRIYEADRLLAQASALIADQNFTIACLLSDLQEMQIHRKIADLCARIDIMLDMGPAPKSGTRRAAPASAGWEGNDDLAKANDIIRELQAKEASAAAMSARKGDLRLKGRLLQSVHVPAGATDADFHRPSLLTKFAGSSSELTIVNHS